MSDFEWWDRNGNRLVERNARDRDALQATSLGPVPWWIWAFYVALAVLTAVVILMAAR